MKFYVYEWFNVETDEIFYVGKGCNNRYKVTSRRNPLFLEYYENNDCASRIIQYFDSEDAALEYEHKHILELKELGQCFCNIDDGGTGGRNFVWTEDMRKHKSQFNPMKNPETAEQVAKQKRKIVIYNENEYTCKELAELTGYQITTIWKWCQRGYDTEGKPCYYKDNPINAIKKTTNSKAVLIDGQYFPSLRAAAEFLGVKDSSPLCKALKNNKPYKGHICEYANQQPSEENSSNSILEGSTTNG